MVEERERWRVTTEWRVKQRGDNGAASVSCSSSAVCVLRHATSFCDCASGGPLKECWVAVEGGEVHNPRTTQKSISAEYLIEFERR